MSGLLELAGKTALITGGGRRLGAATVRALANRGVHCIIHHRTSEADAVALAESVRRTGVDTWLVRGHLGEPEGADRIWEAAVREAGRVDFLINSASIFPEGALDDLSAETLFPNLQINTLAPARLARHFAAQGRGGVIINFLDTMMRDYDKRHVPYHFSKRMLHDLTRMMAVEYAPDVRVNAVAPGLVLAPAGKQESYLEGLRHSTLLQTYGNAEQVTHAVLFLLENSFVTGQTIYIDGGRNLRGSMYE